MRTPFGVGVAVNDSNTTSKSFRVQSFAHSLFVCAQFSLDVLFIYQTAFQRDDEITCFDEGEFP